MESFNVGDPNTLLELKRYYEIIPANIFRTYDYYTVTAALDLDNECRVAISCVFHFHLSIQVLLMHKCRILAYTPS